MATLYPCNIQGYFIFSYSLGKLWSNCLFQLVNMLFSSSLPLFALSKVQTDFILLIWNFLLDVTSVGVFLDLKTIKELQHQQESTLKLEAKGWKIQWAVVKEKAVREWAGVVGKTHGLQGENRSITNFSTKLHSHCFPINAGWRVYWLSPPPLSLFYHLLQAGIGLFMEKGTFYPPPPPSLSQHCDCWLDGLCSYI